MKHGHFTLKQQQKKEPYICTRCLRDKNDTKKFSFENSLLPSAVPAELENLTQIEEMLIARVFPVMSVYTKPGGQRAYRVIVAVTVSALMIMHPEFVCFSFV